MSRRCRTQELDQVEVRLSGERFSSYKKVGVWIDKGLTWREQIEAVQRKCFMGLSKLKKLRCMLSTCTKKRIFCALVQPHLDYCCVL